MKSLTRPAGGKKGRRSPGVKAGLEPVEDGSGSETPTEEALRRSEERYRALFETAFAGISIGDPEENIILANPTFCELLGHSRAELVGMNLSQITGREEFSRYQELTKQRRKGVRNYYESTVYRKDGTPINVIISASPLTGRDGVFEGVLTVVLDITTRKRAEEALQKARDELEQRVEERTAELQKANQSLQDEVSENARLFEEVRAGRERMQALSHRLVEVQEEERRRIARELHDEVGQTLTGLKLTLEMGRRLPPGGAEKTGLEEAHTLENDLISKVRDMSLELRPAMLDDLGLLPCLLWHFERFTTQTRIQVGFHHNGLEGRRFSPEVETAAYRIIQEALTNVARHAGTHQATVRVWVKQDTLNVQVEDQGPGFEPEATLSAGVSSGLSGMRERAILVGGVLTVESSPGRGTQVMARLPLEIPGD